MRGRFGFFGILAVIALVLLVGGIAYSLGVNAGQTVTVAAPGTAAAPGAGVYPVGYYHGFGWGFPFFGLFGILFVFLLIGLLIRAFRPRPWGGWHGAWGPGFGPGRGWGGWSGRFDDVPPQVRPMLESWHRQAHDGTPGDESSGRTGPDAPPPAR